MKKGSELKKFEGIRSEKVAVEGRTTTREDSPKRAPYLAQLAPWRRTEAALTFQKLGPFDDRVGEHTIERRGSMPATRPSYSGSLGANCLI